MGRPRLSDPGVPEAFGFRCITLAMNRCFHLHATLTRMPRSATRTKPQAPLRLPVLLSLWLRRDATKPMILRRSEYCRDHGQLVK